MNIKLSILLFLFSFLSEAQQTVPGNVIPEYGKTFVIEDPEFPTATSEEFKVVFDISRGFKPTGTNKLIETAARFLNMHELAGVSEEKMNVALVIHGNAVKDLLLDTYYTREFKKAKRNPNLPLLEELHDAGVEIIICGQSASFYNIEKEKTFKNAKFALSAMTALVQLQNKDYRLIKF